MGSTWQECQASGACVAKVLFQPAPQGCSPHLLLPVVSVAQGRRGLGKGQDSQCWKQDTDLGPERRMPTASQFLFTVLGKAPDW